MGTPSWSLQLLAMIPALESVGRNPPSAKGPTSVALNLRKRFNLTEKTDIKVPDVKECWWNIILKTIVVPCLDYIFNLWSSTKWSWKKTTCWNQFYSKQAIKTPPAHLLIRMVHGVFILQVQLFNLPFDPCSPKRKSLTPQGARILKTSKNWTFDTSKSSNYTNYTNNLKYEQLWNWFSTPSYQFIFISIPYISRTWNGKPVHLGAVPSSNPRVVQSGCSRPAHQPATNKQQTTNNKQTKQNKTRELKYPNP